MGHLILIANGLHNFIGGLAVASAFFIDHRVGLITRTAAAAHEVPQELGDFGILLNSGWDRGKALLFNVVSGSTFLVGGLVAYTLSGSVNIVFRLVVGKRLFRACGPCGDIPVDNSLSRICCDHRVTTGAILGSRSIVVVRRRK